jgi:hypothetical protein
MTDVLQRDRSNAVTWGQALAVFVAVAMLDFFWVQYMKAVQNRDRLRAAGASSVLILLGAVSVLSYSDSPLYVIPAALGAAFGTVLAMRKEHPPT